MLGSSVLVFYLLAASAPAPAEMVIGPVEAARSGIELVTPVPKLLTPGSRFRGKLLLFGSTVPARIDSPLVFLPDGRSRMEGMIEYKGIQPAFLNRIQRDWVDYRLTGSVVTSQGPRRADWRGRIDRPYVRLKEPLTDILGRFVELEKISIGRVGLKQSAINMNVSVRQPLPFDLSFHRLSYALKIQGRVVGVGEREAFSLRGNRWNLLQMPIRVDHSALFSALGRTVWKRGEVAGELSGTGRLGLPLGEEDFSFRLPVKVSLL